VGRRRTDSPIQSVILSAVENDALLDLTARPLGGAAVHRCDKRHIFSIGFSRRGHNRPLTPTPPHHKTSVTTITDIHSAVRDTEDEIGASRAVPVSGGGHRIRQNPILGSSLTTKRSKITAKSLVLKDFSYKSLKVKELAGISR
jgi:hypothetical protein